MSASVSEFMEKPHRKYVCGKRTEADKKVLAAAFMGSSKETEVEEKKRFEEILDAVAQTKKGRETIAALKKIGCSFGFFEFGGGAYIPDENKIVLNPNNSFLRMLPVLVHEGRHAVQHSLRGKDAPEYSEMETASLLRSQRAIEADATAHESAFVYELKKVNPAAYRDAVSHATPMLREYIAVMDRTKDEKAAMQACFQSWYDYDGYRDFYDQHHRRFIENGAPLWKEKGVAGCFSKEVPAEEVLSTCLFKGKPYIDPEFLNSPRAFSIPAIDRALILKATKEYAAGFDGAKPDTSVEKMYVRNEFGNIIREVRPQDIKVAVMKAVSAKGGR